MRKPVDARANSGALRRLGLGLTLTPLLLHTVAGCHSTSDWLGGAPVSLQEPAISSHPPMTDSQAPAVLEAGTSAEPDAALPPEEPPVDPPDSGLTRGLPTVLVQYSGDETVLNYAVRVSVDMRPWIEPVYRVLPDCTNLEVVGPDGPLDFWVEEPTCGAENGVIWVKIPALNPAEPSIRLDLRVNPAPAKPSNGAAVFRFFRDFNAAEVLNAEDWIQYGPHPLEQNGDGSLRLPAALTPHRAAIQSRENLVRSGLDAVGVRFKGSPSIDDDFEFGVGRIEPLPDLEAAELWRGSRSGTWMSAVHFKSLGFSSGSPTECFWDESSPSYVLAKTWYEIEYRYSAGVPNLFQLTQDIDRSHEALFSDPNCPQLPEQLPILISFDHVQGGLDEGAELDWLYVRPTVAVPPVIRLR